MYLQWKTGRKLYMAYKMAATGMTLNDLEDHSQAAYLFKCNPSNIYAAFYTMCLRSLCVSCMNRETTDKRIVYARNTDSA